VRDEVLLELVKDDEHRLPRGASGSAQELIERLVRVELVPVIARERDAGGTELVEERRSLPVAEEQHRLLLPHRGHDAGEQERALADPRGAVEERQPPRAQVRRDDALVPLAAVEERAVLLVVRLQADPGRRRGRGHVSRLRGAVRRTR
jgi:hypothetical protein